MYSIVYYVYANPTHEVANKLMCILYIVSCIIIKYTCLSQLSNCRSQSLLDHLGRCLKLFLSTDSTSPHEFASPFGKEFFHKRKAPKNIAQTESRASDPSKRAVTPATVDRSPATTWAATTRVIEVTDWAKTEKSNKSKGRQQEFIPSRIEKCDFGIIT